jgi:hypothetical protein
MAALAFCDDPYLRRRASNGVSQAVAAKCIDETFLTASSQIEFWIVDQPCMQAAQPLCETRDHFT